MFYRKEDNPVKGQLDWFKGGILLGLVFIFAVLLVKPTLGLIAWRLPRQNQLTKKLRD
jgi:hypothetical protein